jgi:hypothetical protein
VLDFSSQWQIPERNGLKVEGFILAHVVRSTGSVLRQTIMTKICEAQLLSCSHYIYIHTHICVYVRERKREYVKDRSEKEREGDQRQDIPFRTTPLVIYFLQLGTTFHICNTSQLSFHF